MPLPSSAPLCRHGSAVLICSRTPNPCLVIFGSLAPGHSGVVHLIDLGAVNDKVEHLAAYAFLAALPSLHRFRCRRIGAAIVFLFLLDRALELGQLLVGIPRFTFNATIANMPGAFRPRIGRSGFIALNSAA